MKVAEMLGGSFNKARSASERLAERTVRMKTERGAPGDLRLHTVPIHLSDEGDMGVINREPVHGVYVHG